MGWNEEPDYTPPNPPLWFWGVVAAVVIGAVALIITAN